jgi:solute carrier family 13 (sodium-dependent dicarboxylate transporter), member 2/3/5
VSVGEELRHRGPLAPSEHELEEVIVDTRPIAVVLLSRSVRPFILLAGVLAFFLLARATPPPGLSPVGQRAIAVFAVAVVYWVTGALPLMVTSLLIIVLLGLSGVLPARSAYALFGNEAVFFVLAAFMLAAAVSHRGLGRRVALLVFRRFGRTPGALLGSVYLLSAFMSFVVPEHAVAAMVFPIVLDLVDSMEDLRAHDSHYASALFLAMAWGVNIGGIATLLGGARGPLALGILNEATGQTISFMRWSMATVPLVFVMLAIGYAVLRIFFPLDINEISSAGLSQRTAELGRTPFEQKAVAVILVLTVLAWLFGSQRWGFAGIAIMAVVALFAFNLLSWNEVEEYVNWGIILMYGGAIALGSALQKTGAATYIAQIVGATPSITFAIAILSLAALMLGEALSHSAVVAAVLPVGLGLANRLGLDPRCLTLAITVPAGLTFVLPVGTPANALAHSGGYLKVRELLAPGLVMHICSWIGINLAAHFYWPIIGFGIR